MLEYTLSVHGYAFMVKTSPALLCSTIAAYAPLVAGAGGSRFSPHLFRQITEYMQGLSARFHRRHFIELAITATKDFTWPPEVERQDYNRLRCAGSLLKLVQQCQISRQPSCFNRARVESCLQGVSNYDIVLELATTGVVIDPPSGFRCQSSDVSIRPLMRSLVNCQHTHVLKAWRAGRVMVLPHANLSSSDLEGVHINPTHWTPKPNLQEKAANVLGRPLVDPSNGPPDQVLNTEGARLASIARYGKVDDPLIEDIITDWFAFSRRTGIPLSECSL